MNGYNYDYLGPYYRGVAAAEEDYYKRAQQLAQQRIWDEQIRESLYKRSPGYQQYELLRTVAPTLAAGGLDILRDLLRPPKPEASPDLSWMIEKELGGKEPSATNLYEETFPSLKPIGKEYEAAKYPWGILSRAWQGIFGEPKEEEIIEKLRQGRTQQIGRTALTGLSTGELEASKMPGFALSAFGETVQKKQDVQNKLSDIQRNKEIINSLRQKERQLARFPGMSAGEKLGRMQAIEDEIKQRKATNDYLMNQILSFSPKYEPKPELWEKSGYEFFGIPSIPSALVSNVLNAIVRGNIPFKQKE